MSRVAVLGSGVIGISAAFRLSEAGHQVTVISESTIGGVTSQTSFAWVNSNNKDPRVYHDLNVAGMRAHAELQAELVPESPWYLPTGCLMAHDSAADRATSLQRMSELDYPATTMSDADVRVLEPALALPHDECLFFPTEGLVHVDRFIAELWERAQAGGAQFVHSRVERVSSSESASEVVLASGVTLPFDHVVMALGKVSDSVPVNGNDRVPMHHAPGVDAVGGAAASPATSVATHCFLGYSATGGERFSRVYVSDSLNFRPFGEAGLVLQAPELEYLLDQQFPEEHLEDVRAFMEAKVNGLLEPLPGREGNPIHVDHVIIGERSLPADGHPVLGFVDEHRRVSAAVSHSGVTLAALYGRLAVDFVAGCEPEVVRPFTLRRFADGGAFDLYQQSGVGRQ